MSSVWDDFDHFITYYIPKQTIARLRQFAHVIEKHSRIRLQLKSTERKADLVSKISVAFQTMRANNQASIYQAARSECEAIAANRYNSPSVLPPPTFGTVSSATYSAHNAARQQQSLNPANGYGAGGSWQRGSTSTNVYSTREATLVDWKPSPMWKPIKALTNMEMLPDIQTSENSHTRREKRVVFTLPTDVVEGLNKSKNDPRSRPHYSVRLFCASSEYYRPPNMAPPPGMPMPSNRQIPIEYPGNPDVILDGHMVPFKERGLRGKAGSAPPLDIDKSSRGLVRMPGRMASVTMGHTGPTVSKKKEYSKKFWFQLVYCEYTSMEDLLVRLESLPPTDPEVELARLRQRAEDHEDIEIGPSTLSLKDPLSGMRITKPVRSSKCSHLQCFDARWWLESNKSHPQWLCPHCSKELEFTDVICDGYFLSILRAVPDTFDEVTLESNGEWHTQNNQYGSTEWLAENGAAPEPAQTLKRPRSATPTNITPGKRRAIEILSDSDDDDDESETPATSVANGNASTNGTNSRGISRVSRSTASAQPPAIIDLTLSSDEEESDDEARLHFRRPGGSSTSHDGADSELRPASDLRSHPQLSPKRLPGSGSGASSAPPAPPASGAYGASSSVRDPTDSSSRPPSFPAEGLTAAHILAAAERFGRRHSPLSASSSRPDTGQARPSPVPPRPTDGLSAAQILAAAERFGPRAQSSSGAPSSGVHSGRPNVPLTDSYRPPSRPAPAPANGYSHHS